MKSKERNENVTRMVNYVSQKYCESKFNCGRIKKGLFNEIVKDANNKFNTNEQISIKTIQSRYRRKNLYVEHRGTPTPMAPLESALLEIVIQMGKMNQPLTVNEGLQLANSMIKPGSNVEKKVLSYLKSRGQYKIDGTSTKSPGNLLGVGYWHGFRKRYKHQLVSKRGVQFGHNRSEWCKYNNFKIMYDLVYESMEIAGVAEKLPQPEWQNGLGEKVGEENAVGEMVEYKVTYPEYILFADEVGNNTCQKDDGHVGGQKFLVKRGSQPRQGSSTSDVHWTTMGFTSGSGKPVMCAIIIAAETLSVEDRLGIDIFAECDEDILSDANYGPGKYFPGGPRCTFNGTDIPCYINASPKGSITSDILADILKWIDDKGVYPRNENGPTPFLLLDGHGSRLEIPFLSYINDPSHKWVVCIGVPNGTSVWQVGDSNEQNGCYKMYSTQYKQMITKRRLDLGMFKLNIVRSDIIPIVNYAWARSFF